MEASCERKKDNIKNALQWVKGGVEKNYNNEFDENKTIRMKSL